jgi:hypothetical protein
MIDDELPYDLSKGVKENMKMLKNGLVKNNGTDPEEADKMVNKWFAPYFPEILKNK